MYWTTFKKSDPSIWIVDSASVAVDDLIYSFNGVLRGNEPIDINVLNTHTLQWSLLPHPIGINGERLKPPDVPKKRFGHTVVAYDKKIYLWGGENGGEACNTLYSFDTKTLNWSRPKVSGIIPSSRIFHSACTFNHLMYVFGGDLSYTYQSNLDVHCLDLKTMNWSYIKTTGETPSCRRYRATIINDRMYILEDMGESVVYLDLKSNCWHRQETTGEKPYINLTTSLVVHNSIIYVCTGSDLYYFDTKRNHWNLIRPRGKSPKQILSQSCVVIGDKMFLLGYSRFYKDEDTDEDTDEETDEETDEDTDKYRNVIHVLDFNPSLKTLAIMEIIENGLDFSCLPTQLRSEIHDFKLGNI